ncbi:hypothetical protein NC652_013234 [Populus alba x Populus x berolinensis]|nr:hypothetical protein NC652_013234 [Populus alba x Populus x berolinensis]
MSSCLVSSFEVKLSRIFSSQSHSRKEKWFPILNKKLQPLVVYVSILSPRTRDDNVLACSQVALLLWFSHTWQSIAVTITLRLDLPFQQPMAIVEASALVGSDMALLSAIKTMRK